MEPTELIKEEQKPATSLTGTKTAPPDDLKTLIEKNIKWSQAVYEQNQKILRRMTMMTIANYLRLALILIPLVIALIYLPAFINQYLGAYQELFNGAQGLQQDGATMQQLQELLKQYQR